jgi:hypothetical protein
MLIFHWIANLDIKAYLVDGKLILIIKASFVPGKLILIIKETTYPKKKINENMIITPTFIIII